MIGYPNGKKINRQPSLKTQNKSNLGQTLEDDVNSSNQFYRELNIALVYKKPTPVTVVSVDYPKRSASMITKAFFQLPSTTDYNGIYQGIPIDFEAKQTQNKTRLPLSMIHAHQLEHLNAVIQHGGISFLIIRFVKHDETYLLPFPDLNKYIQENQAKSIPYTWIKSNSYLITSSFQIPCDYISALKSYLIDKEFINGK